MAESKIVNFLIFLSVFISSITFFNDPFEGYFHYIIFIVLLPVFIFNFGFPTQPLKILIIPLAVGVLQIFLGNNTWPFFLKIFIGVLLSATFYYYVLAYFKYDTERIFRIYLKWAIAISIIGLVQFVSFHLKITPLYNFNWIFNKWGYVNNQYGIRINSVFSEASQCAIVLSPACLVAFYNLIPGNSYVFTKFQSWLIIITVFLTTSSTGYLGFLLIIFLFSINYGKITIFLASFLIIFFGAQVLYNYVPEFKTRVDTSVALWSDSNFSVENVNSSSFVLFNNYHIATENFSRNFLTGTGLGSHQIAFDRYTLTQREGILDVHFNKADANSLLIRIISEAGLIGIVFVLWLIFGNFVRKNLHYEKDHLWLVSNGVLVIILLYMLRQGNYFLNGFPLFMWLYYFTKKQAERNRIEELEAAAKEEEEEEEETELENGEELAEET